MRRAKCVIVQNKNKMVKPLASALITFTAFSSRERIIAKEHNKYPANQHKQRCTGRVRDLYFKSTTYKFAAIPQAAACFAGHNINGTGNKANNPTRNNY